MTIGDANLLVQRWHRHHKKSQGGLFALGIADGERICGAAIVGRPVARALDDGWTAEVVRCVTDGTRNSASMLMSRCWRVCQQMGYKRLVTYTLEQEGGTSLVAAGYRCVGRSGGGSWSRRSRPRVDKHPLQQKIRWEKP